MAVIPESGGLSLERAVWTCNHDHCYVLPPVSEVDEPLELKVEEIEDDAINWTENSAEVEEDETGKSDEELDERMSDDEEFSKDMLYKYFENSEETVSSEENNMDEDRLGIESERKPQQKCEESEGWRDLCKSTEGRNGIAVSFPTNGCAQSSSKDNEMEGVFSLDNLQPVECEMCEKIFQGQDQLEKHLVIHLGSVSFQCSFCKRVFPTVKYLKNHKKWCKQQNRSGEIISKASDDKFNSGHNLKKHVEMESMKCDMCEKEFDNKSGLEDHISKQECIAQTSESPEDNLKSQSIIHEEKKITCRICNQAFTPVKLIDHLLEHNTQLMSDPSVTNKRFKKEMNQQNNETSVNSLSDTTFNCAFCSNSGMKKSALEWHLKTHVKKLRMRVLYPNNENNISIQDEFACDKCSAKFASEKDTLLHMEKHCSKQISSNPKQEKEDANLDSSADGRVSLRLKSYASLSSKPIIHGYVVLTPSKLLKNSESDEQKDGEPMSFKPLMKARRQYVLCAPMPGTNEAECHSNSGGKNLLQHLYAVKTGDSSDPGGATVKYTDSLADTLPENTVTYKCNLCEEIFQWKSYLFSHILKHENYVCSCGEGIGLLTPLHRHVYHHRMKQSCQCEICGKTYRRMSQLKPHLRDHYNKERKHECETCGRTFVRPNELRKHKMRHKGEKPHVCDKCGTAFLDSHALKRHENTHTDNKPFQCKVCKKDFRVRDNLQVHMRIHTGEKPYKCSKCPQAFNHNVSLKNHKKRFHSEDA